MEHIQVSKTGEMLTISITESIIQLDTLNAKITISELHELKFSEDTHGIVTGFSSTHNLTLTLSGVSSLNPDILARYVEITLEGTSHLHGEITVSEDVKLFIGEVSSVDLTGGAKNLLVEECVGGISVDLSKFHVNNANVNLSGASNATIKLDSKFDAHLSGASSLYYIGEPTMGNIVTSEGSTVSKQ